MASLLDPDWFPLGQVEGYVAEAVFSGGGMEVVESCSLLPWSSLCLLTRDH